MIPSPTSPPAKPPRSTPGAEHLADGVQDGHRRFHADVLNGQGEGCLHRRAGAQDGGQGPQYVTCVRYSSRDKNQYFGNETKLVVFLRQDQPVPAGRSEDVRRPGLPALSGNRDDGA